MNIKRSNVIQLIVGPHVWAYKVLRQTLGERFMEDFEVGIFIAQ